MSYATLAPQAHVARGPSSLVSTVRATVPCRVERGRSHVFGLGSVAGDHPYPHGDAHGDAERIFWRSALPQNANINHPQTMPSDEAFSPRAIRRGGET